MVDGDSSLVGHILIIYGADPVEDRNWRGLVDAVGNGVNVAIDWLRARHVPIEASAWLAPSWFTVASSTLGSMYDSYVLVCPWSKRVVLASLPRDLAVTHRVMLVDAATSEAATAVLG